MVSCLPLVQDRCLPPRSIGLDDAWQQIKAGFIDKNEMAALSTGLFFEDRPPVNSPMSDRLLIALDGAGNRDLWGPSQIFEQARNLALAVGDFKLLGEHSGNALASPEIS